MNIALERDHDAPVETQSEIRLTDTHVELDKPPEVLVETQNRMQDPLSGIRLFRAFFFGVLFSIPIWLLFFWIVI